MPSALPFTALVTNPHQQLLDKIQSIKEQIKLEKEHQDLIRQLEALKMGRVEKSSSEIKPENQTTPPEQLKPPIKGASLKAQIRQDNLSVPSETEAFPVTETTEAQGQVWRHHNGFDFKVIKEIKVALAQYGATAPLQHGHSRISSGKLAYSRRLEISRQALHCQAVTISCGNQNSLRIVTILCDAVHRLIMGGLMIR